MSKPCTEYHTASWRCNTLDEKREIEFFAALLVVGPINAEQFVSFDPGGEPKAWRHREDRVDFMNHKSALISWLIHNNVVNPVFNPSHPPVGAHLFETLSREAAAWIGEFYQWLVEQQHGH